jgi:hemerythrin superfamily protein
MDAFTVLRQDHQNASALFKKIQGILGEPDTPERHELFRQLKGELDLHAKVEDLHVYRVFQQAEPTRDSAAKALEAHRKIETLLDELAAVSRYDAHWVSKFKELQQIVEQHVAAEEQEMFAKAQDVLTPQEAEELGTTVETAKKDIQRDASPQCGGTPE